MNATKSDLVVARLDLYRWKIINLRANATSKRLQYRIVSNISKVPQKHILLLMTLLFRKAKSSIISKSSTIHHAPPRCVNCT